ncbi:hypothetical protein CKS_2211 [Pantoea stewartii subsp. stewartii DC283]|uniref:Uncharacterized protein n=1 Tax=Pantoea stewartii subsp. stewartii DC283 TaxID=660596 RepID=H3REM8_PANSE|nr:hypothetical protein CKS_2211 [Pantoea stewartii subsp. stewartii DC283]
MDFWESFFVWLGLKSLVISSLLELAFGRSLCFPSLDCASYWQVLPR